MLTYLGAALPRFSSPTARLLALQCALRADRRGRVHLPCGLLRGMRLAGHAVPWHELTDAGWLQCYTASGAKRARGGVEAQLLDATVLAQASARSDRARAAHWALRPAPVAVPRQAPVALQLTALVIAAHTPTAVGSAEADRLTRLCGLSWSQLPDLLDRLVHAQLLGGWQHAVEDAELHWHLPTGEIRTV
ncbi:hypothetical protein [Streptomyces sp. CA-132043]|uniref:hypothetical protein n=1 Tax=Streptomyces sp. CA-132043 TaxID=3240048 RepID=UPI003D8CAED3